MKTQKTTMMLVAVAAMAACQVNATYYTAKATGSQNLSVLSWTPRNKTGSFAAGDTLRIECGADNASVAIDTALDGVYLKFDVPEGETMTATFNEVYGGEGNLYKLGEGTLVYATASDVTNAHQKTIVQGGTFKFGEGCTAVSNLYLRVGTTLDVNGQYSKGTTLHLSDRTTLTNTGDAMDADFTSAIDGADKAHEQFTGGIYFETNAVVTIQADNAFGMNGVWSSSWQYAQTVLNLNGGMLVKKGSAAFGWGNHTVTGAGLIRIEEGEMKGYNSNSSEFSAPDTILDIREGCTFSWDTDRQTNENIKFKKVIGSGTLKRATNYRKSSPKLLVSGSLDGRLLYADSNTAYTADTNCFDLAANATLDLSQISTAWTMTTKHKFNGAATIDVGRRTFDAETQIVSWTAETRPATDPTVTGLWINGNYTISDTGITVTPLDSTKVATYTDAAVTLAELPTQPILYFNSDSDQTLTLSGVSAANCKIVKAGSGTLTIARADSELLQATASVYVLAGKLKLSFACAAPITVASGATLDTYSQEISGKLYLADGSTLTTTGGAQASNSSISNGMQLEYCATVNVVLSGVKENKNYNCIRLGTAQSRIANASNYPYDMNYGMLVLTGGNYLLLDRNGSTFYRTIFTNHGTIRCGSKTRVHLDGNGAAVTAQSLTLDLIGGYNYQQNGGWAEFRRIIATNELATVWMKGNKSHYPTQLAYGIEGKIQQTTDNDSFLEIVEGGVSSSLGNETIRKLSHIVIANENQFALSGNCCTNSAGVFTAGSDCEIAVTGTKNILGATTLGERSVITVTEPVTAGTLTLGGDTLVVLEGDGAIVFADSSAKTWSGNLTILDNTGNAGNGVKFGTSSSGLSATQLAGITYNGYEATINSSGYLHPKNGLLIIFR